MDNETATLITDMIEKLAELEHETRNIKHNLKEALAQELPKLQALYESL